MISWSRDQSRDMLYEAVARKRKLGTNSEKNLDASRSCRLTLSERFSTTAGRDYVDFRSVTHVHKSFADAGIMLGSCKLI